MTSVGSVLGGAFGYAIGLYFMDALGYNVLEFYGLTEKYHYIQELYRTYDAWAVGIAGFTPIPYKVFTISAGAFDIDLTVFLVASVISRSARFFLIGWLIHRYGESIRAFIDRYLNLLTVALVGLLVAGFIIVKLAGG